MDNYQNFISKNKILLIFDIYIFMHITKVSPKLREKTSDLTC